MMLINNCSTFTKYEMCFSLEVRKTVVLAEISPQTGHSDMGRVIFNVIKYKSIYNSIHFNK